MKEYLPLLTVRKKWTNHHENIGVGDIVFIQEKNIERSKPELQSYFMGKMVSYDR